MAISKYGITLGEEPLKQKVATAIRAIDSIGFPTADISEKIYSEILGPNQIHRSWDKKTDIVGDFVDKTYLFTLYDINETSFPNLEAALIRITTMPNVFERKLNKFKKHRERFNLALNNYEPGRLENGPLSEEMMNYFELLIEYQRTVQE